MSYSSDDFLKAHPDAETRGELISEMWPLFVYGQTLFGPSIHPGFNPTNGPFCMRPDNEITMSTMLAFRHWLDTIATYLKEHGAP